jgi:hypothetical protein
MLNKNYLKKLKAQYLDNGELTDGACLDCLYDIIGDEQLDKEDKFLAMVVMLNDWRDENKGA